MCRLLYFRGGRGNRPERKALVRWLASMERSLGGHGNGVYVGGTITKGLNLTVEKCANLLLRDMRRPALWHTRFASCGFVSDDLCQPFFTHGRAGLVHNGHWSVGAEVATGLGPTWSDTRVAAAYVKRYGWRKFVESCDSGVWLHLTKDGLQVHRASGQLHVEIHSGCLASEPCPEWGTWEFFCATARRRRSALA